jgi:hypothetical protein
LLSKEGTVQLAKVSLAAVLAVVSSPAGVVLKGRMTDLDDKKTSEMVMYVDASRLRVDTTAGDGDMSMIVLLAGDDYQLIMLNRKENQYQVMDRKTAAQMDEAVSAAMAQMEAQLKQLPPEQRAMVEKMMGKKLGGAAAKPAQPPAMTYRAAGAGTAGGRPCKKYEVFQGQEKVSELCAVPPAAVGLTAKEMALFDKVAEAMEDMTRGVRRYFDVGSIQGPMSAKQIDGFPVEQVIFRNGKPSARMEFYSSEQRALTDADFSTGNAKRVEMPQMPGAR